MMRLVMVLMLSLALALAAACGNGDDEEAAPDGAASPDAAASPEGGAAGRPTPAADAPTLTVGSASLEIGEEGSVDVEILGFPPPGLGAWTMDVAYDPAVIAVGECEPYAGSVCNPEFDETTVRIAGAAAFGLEGDTALVAIAFTCEAAGSSPLALTIDTLADATIGDPQHIGALVEDGEITCTGVEQATPPPEE